MKRLCGILIVLIAVFALISCGGGGGGGGGSSSAPAASNSLIGTWVADDGTETMEWTFDNTNLTIKDYINSTLDSHAIVPYTVSGNVFSFNVHDGTVVYGGSSTGINRVVSFEYSVSGNNLTVTNCKYDGVLHSADTVIFTRR